jgi:hypothetical protein
LCSRITEIVAQGHDVELANRFFRRELDWFAAHQAGDVGLFAGVLERDRGFKRLNLIWPELRQLVGAVFEEF